MEDDRIEPQDEMNQEDFRKMLESSLNKRDNFSPGDEVAGKIVFLTKEYAFLDISGKSEAMIDLKELKNDKEEVTVKQGDIVKAWVVSVRGGEIHLTTAIGKGQAGPELIEKAHKYSIPVEGLVTNTVNGGYAVSVSGVQAFCPFSQIDLKSPPRPEDMINRRFDFRVIQFSEKGRNIVLSRRALLEERKKTREEELQKTLKEGDLVTGTVQSIADFGVFLDIGGVEALVPKSEVSWGRNPDMKTFKAGEEITARVLSLDWAGRRIALSIKQMTPGPWERIKNFEIGQTINGRVTNIIKSGAFVELEPGLEGFLPVSKMSFTKRIARPEDVVSVGASVSVKILDIRPGEKRISLELLTGEADPWELPDSDLRENILSGIVESAKSSGVTLRLDNGMVGYIPREELAAKKGADLQKEYVTGRTLKVVIKDMSRQNRKLILSEADALSREEMLEYGKFVRDNAPDDSAGSAFGKLFKDKFEKLHNK